MARPGPKPRPLDVRLFKRVDRLYGFEPEHRPELGPCWPFMGAKNADGYGIIRGEIEAPNVQPLVLAHRVALAIALGRPIREGMFANHKCDNPACCRPSHLKEGTHQENIDDMMERGRWQPPKLPKQRRLG